MIKNIKNYFYIYLIYTTKETLSQVFLRSKGNFWQAKIPFPLVLLADCRSTERCQKTKKLINIQHGKRTVYGAGR